MISSALTLHRSSLFSSPDTLNSFLSSVIKLSFSWSNIIWRHFKPSNSIMQDKLHEYLKKKINRYPSDGIRLSFEGPKDTTICFPLNVVDLSFHVILWHSRHYSRTYNCRSSISSRAAPSLKSILMWREVIICSCNYFIKKQLLALFLMCGCQTKKDFNRNSSATFTGTSKRLIPRAMWQEWNKKQANKN